MDVLVTLCNRAGEVVSTEDILMACWGATISGDNPVHKTIAQLRRVLDDSAVDPRYIETIRKRGYRVVGEVVRADGSTAQAVDGSWTRGSPFRGLEAFDEDHATVFFGRNEAITQVLRALGTQSAAGRALVLVLGPSGCGKTSLIRAGVLPALMRPQGFDGLQVCSASTFDLSETAGGNLLSALGDAMLKWRVGDKPAFMAQNGDALSQQWAQHPTTAMAELKWVLEGAAKSTANLLRLALFVDRIEALFARDDVSDAARESFLAVLDTLARSGHVLVIAACRNDFYPRIAESPLLMAGKAQGAHIDLYAPAVGDIAQMIRLPARAAHLSFGIDPKTQAKLDDLLCDSAAASPDALPLLQYTLQELYRMRTPQGELTFDAFHHLGGIEGAIGLRAEELINDLADGPREALPRVLSLVATVSTDEEVVTSRRAPWSALQNDDERTLVTALVDARLFVSELVGREPGFGVAHEALLRRWPRVIAWVDAHRQSLKVRARVNALAARWQAEGKPGDLLLPPGKQLDEARKLLDVSAFSLAPHELELIAASTRKAKLRDRLRQGVLATIIGLAVLAGVLGLNAVAAKKVAERQRAEVEGLLGYMVGNLADRLRTLGRLDLLDGVSNKALEYLTTSSSDNLNSASIIQRAKALEVIGEVRFARGDAKAALEAFGSSYSMLQALYRKQPKDSELLKSLGVTAFWLGNTQLRQNQMSETQRYFEAYRDYSDAFSALNPDDVDAWIEQSYAHNSLGSLAMARGNPKRAVEEFDLSISLKSRALARKPDDSRLSGDLANSLSWAATASTDLGRLQSAVELSAQELAIAKKLYAEMPGEQLWGKRFALATEHKANIDEILGQDALAISEGQEAVRVFDQMIKMEPENRTWQGWRAHAEMEVQSRLLRRDAAQSVLTALLSSAEKIAALRKSDPHQLDWAQTDAMLHVQLADANFRIRHYPEAREAVLHAQAVLEQLYQENRSELWTHEALARARLMRAQIERATGDAEVARGECKAAFTLLDQDAKARVNTRAVATWVSAGVCLGEKDAVAEAETWLAHIGFRDATYLASLTHNPS